MRDPLDWVLLVAEIVLAVVAVGFAVARRRGGTGTLAWILAILAFPGVGAIAYFFLANPYIRRPRRRRRTAARAVRETNVMAPPPDPTHDLPEQQRSLLRGVADVSGLLPTGGNRVQVLVDNREAFRRKEEAILGARERVWAEYYIVHPDGTGRRFLELLTERAREGLEVRLLFDAVGSADIDAPRVRALRDAGGQVAAFLPVNPLRRHWAVHLRNHRKILVADGRVAFVGGMNVGDEYSGRRGLRVRRRPPWRDTHLRVEGPAARDLALVFDEDWCFMTGEVLRLPDPVEPAGDATVAILPSGPDQDDNAAAVAWFSCINLALARCWIATPYFAPDDGILRSLTGAARRGVDVRLLLPERNDMMLMGLANRSFYGQLLRAGVRIYEYRPTMLHAKTLVMDGSLAMVGSANVDMRSFRLNFEAGALVADRGFAEELEARFVTDLETSHEITAGWVRRRRPWEVAAQGAAQLLSPLL